MASLVRATARASGFVLGCCGCARRDRRGATNQERRGISTEAAVERSRSHDSEGATRSDDDGGRRHLATIDRPVWRTPSSRTRRSSGSLHARSPGGQGRSSRMCVRRTCLRPFQGPHRAVRAGKSICGHRWETANAVGACADPAPCQGGCGRFKFVMSEGVSVHRRTIRAPFGSLPWVEEVETKAREHIDDSSRTQSWGGVVIVYRSVE